MRHSSRWLIGMTASLVLFLSPAWALASVLEIPGNDVTVSGIGVISGWKCEAEGDITIRLNDGDPIPATYGLPRADTGVSEVCNDDGNNGFFSYTNWGNLGDGAHTAVAYDNGKEFARSTFTVATLGEAFVVGAAGECTVDNFPSEGESATFKWNQSTQHLELVPMETIDPDLAQFDGTWRAETDTMGSSCLITEFDCEISNGALSCLPGGIVRGTVDSSGSVVGVVHLDPAGVFNGTLQDGSGSGEVSYLTDCKGTWTLTRQ